MKNKTENQLHKKTIGNSGGKIILLGEHAVVHGTNSLAVGFADQVKVTATFFDGPLTLHMKDLHGKDLYENKRNYFSSVSGEKPEDNALRQMALCLGVNLRGVILNGETKIPVRAGLGVSAAIAAACSKALCNFFNIKCNYQTLHDAISASEKVFHLNPSGLDAAAVLLCQVITFNRKSGAVNLKVNPPSLIVVHSGTIGETKTTVAAFNTRLLTYAKEGKQRLNQINMLVNKGIESIKNNDLVALGNCMNENHNHLHWFGISTPSLDKICKIGRKYGALGAKLTGGGGGGCAVLLTKPEDRQNIISAIVNAGFKVVI